MQAYGLLCPAKNRRVPPTQDEGQRGKSGKAGGREREETGGLGSSHTVPFGAAVPARPPTRSWQVTRRLCFAQWVGGASVQGTQVVVQGSHFVGSARTS